jgi:hypothetical protein
VKPPILTILLLASTMAFGQRFQDVTAKGSPASLSVKSDQRDIGPYVAAHNNSSRGILAIVASVKVTDEHGQVVPCISYMDYAFKFGVIGSLEDRGVMPLALEPDTKIAHAVGAVLFVQFDDGSTWGDVQAAQEMLAARPQKLEFLKHLVEVYYDGGEPAFNALLDAPTLGRFERAVAGCLKGDAEYERMTTVDLAKKRLADALAWRAIGIF